MPHLLRWRFAPTPQPLRIATFALWGAAVALSVAPGSAAVAASPAASTPVPASTTRATAANGACPAFTAAHGGYRIATDFSVTASPVSEAHSSADGPRADVILTPACLRRGDWLWIRPLRLNPDEYLILQRCNTADCTTAEVVRAWNSSGFMGPYPVLTRQIPVDDGVRYMLWMQRVPMPGVESFSLIERHGRPFVFDPVGRLLSFGYAEKALQAGRARGPTPLEHAGPDDSSFVVKFEGGSVVRMQALRPER
jgi:hypothetical protein